ncbi:unnamed protein product, partial [Mycena citricolor]
MPTDPRRAQPKVALPRFPASHSASMPPTSESNASSAPPKSPRKSPHCRHAGDPAKDRSSLGGDETRRSPQQPDPPRNALPELRLYPHHLRRHRAHAHRCQMHQQTESPYAQHDRGGDTPGGAEGGAAGDGERDRRDKSTADADHVRTRFLQLFFAAQHLNCDWRASGSVGGGQDTDEEEPESLALGDLPVVDEAGKLDQLLRWGAGSPADDSDAGILPLTFCNRLCNDAVPDISSRLTRKSAPLASEETPT